MAKIKFIVGLGNPGKEYNDTRHNIGFRIVDFLSKEHGGTLSVPKSPAERGGNFSASGRPAVGWDLDKKTNSEISEIKINGQKVLLVKPQIFVNKSGEAVNKIVKSLKVSKFSTYGGSAAGGKVSNLIVVHDDLDIPFGKVKVSFGRGSAGHKGVESIIKALKTEKFYRVRVGTFNTQIVKIKKIKDKRKKVKGINDFVVEPFSPNEKPKLNKVIKEAAQKILTIL